MINFVIIGCDNQEELEKLRKDPGLFFLYVAYDDEGKVTFRWKGKCKCEEKEDRSINKLYEVGKNVHGTKIEVAVVRYNEEGVDIDIYVK